MSRPLPGKPLLRTLAAAVTGGFGLAVLFYACALGFRPAFPVPARPPSPEAVARAESAREPMLDLRNPPRITRAVNYAEGSRGAWWPKGEAPVLAQLVREGKLPPVEERVGPEPIVMEGVDGIGHYGGTWQRLAASDFDVATIASLLSYCNLVRWSPEGYPIVPHLAQSWEISDGYRTFTFHLRRGMRWSDGAPVTSDDFVYWYKLEVQALNVAVPDILHYPGTGE
ncbi:MAG TPA: ABC transporter substrate-binding protein, partial [Opitutaceae bacterium]|nr:ABC transporter substrate-binding protein [Opitutaceae bacterium]